MVFWNKTDSGPERETWRGMERKKDGGKREREVNGTLEMFCDKEVRPRGVGWGRIL